MKHSWIIGIDTGGTFTDIVCRRRGELLVLKVPSTRDDPADAVIRGVETLLAANAPDGDRSVVGHVVHGSTVATNTILERKGAATAFVTTEGFGDLVEIGRQNRPSLYDLEVRRPQPLVPRALRVEVLERTLPDGSVATGLDETALRERLERLAGRVEAVAIGFLFSYRNQKHERAAESLIRRLLPSVPVTISSRVSPEMREYERFSTAILNAYVSPRMERYLERLQRRLPGRSLEIMGSGGGTVPVDRARKEPVSTVLSGPAAGVLGARDIARRAGIDRVITFDMGGTSTDVSLVDGDVGYRLESEIGGLPMRLPVIDVHTVGAGGGSIARVDAGGGLRVGPESAGADPGPAVYGRGSDLTVTDAHVALGRLAGDSFLGGEMAVQPERVRPLVGELARAMKTSPSAAARGVLRVVNAEMERAIRVVSQERGHDPRAFTLVAFGGASGLHAVSLARGLLIPRVLIPPHPGMLCAWGMLSAERIRWRARTVQRAAVTLPPRELVGVASGLIDEASADFGDLPRRDLRETLELDMRFEGQTHVLTMRYDARRGRGAKRFAVDRYVEDFLATYRERYRFLDESWPVEVVTVRVSVAARRAGRKTGGGGRGRATTRRRPRPRSRRRVLHDDGRTHDTPIFQRDDLRPGDRMRGPAVIAEYSGTTLAPPGCRVEVDAWGNLVLE